ncbi:hypothetical protein SAMN02745136_00440 [Anaerocolumna jejuensis DSM 15929]|uniref:Uncharacterized protein n=2 Tax=Anaerocolumna TaxID=1843210 RepID=A0A1M6KG61_9FIRM|nr:hypothetical protein SAMN02745136_00440 [Anaerocolumna jejuensis DSM 15929]
MSMKQTISRVSLLLILSMLLSSSMFSIFAETNIPISANDKGDIEAAIKEASEANGTESSSTSEVVIKSTDKNADGTKTAKIFEYNGENSIVFDEKEFKRANQKEARKALFAFVNSLKESSISADTQQEIMNEIQESDSDVAAMMLPMVFDNTKADIFTAYKWLAPFMSVIRVFFGLGSVVIIIMVISSTIFDLAYIGLPVWRETQDEKSGGKKPFGVSHEALSTVREVEKNLEVYKNAYVMYLKRRATTYIVLSIALLWLIAGEMSGLIGWVLSLASGIV